MQEARSGATVAIGNATLFTADCRCYKYLNYLQVKIISRMMPVLSLYLSVTS